MKIVRRVADDVSCSLSFENGVGGAGFSVDRSRDGARTKTTGKERSGGTGRKPGRERVSEQRTSTERSMVRSHGDTRKRSGAKEERVNGLQWERDGQRLSFGEGELRVGRNTKVVGVCSTTGKQCFKLSDSEVVAVIAVSSQQLIG